MEWAVKAFSALLVAMFASACPAADTAWTETRRLPAPEAHQAAAADERFVYAIANKQVAKYDRRTGERVAESAGEATHLNSGFFLESQLYAAHSNYPQTPERSEIKVLDVATMRLTTFKDFGNYGGSLTWAVYRDGHWWCNFARYGENNAETFLVRFTPEWREAARYTYPPELIRRLGRYSLSGGVWLGEDLLVTGHDDPVLFRLHLPASGTVLQLASAERIPFTGQGIAHDPVSGGLVGIDRRNRWLIFAAAKPNLSKPDNHE